jgi:predicted nucleic acid-binding Zn ribbon protein
MGEMSLQEAMQQFLKNSKYKTYIQAIQVEEVWEQIMGKTVAKYTEKIQIIGSTLFITTHVAPLKNELLYQKDTILARVNEALGDKVVKEVVIR